MRPGERNGLEAHGPPRLIVLLPPGSRAALSLSLRSPKGGNCGHPPTPLSLSQRRGLCVCGPARSAGYPSLPWLPEEG